MYSYYYVLNTHVYIMYVVYYRESVWSEGPTRGEVCMEQVSHTAVPK